MTEQTFDSRSRLKTRDVKGGGTLLSHQEIIYDDLDRKTMQTVNESLFGTTVQKTEYFYKPGGQLEKIINPLGHVTRFYYEPETNRLQQQVEEKVEQAQDIVTQYAYDEVNNLVRETQYWDPGQPPLILEHTYDDLNRRTDTVIVQGPGQSPAAKIMHADYDLVGNLLSSTDVHGNTTSYSYDGLYRIVKMELPVSAHSGQFRPACRRRIRLRPGG